jgi:hypothetical protein
MRVNSSDMDLQQLAQSTSEQALDEQLLEESVESLFVGRNRLVVLNAIAAVEVMANRYFVAAAIQAKLGDGQSSEQAAQEAEQERREHRTDLKHLLHCGPASYGARSLCSEDKRLYDDLLSYQLVRHGVAHRGETPDNETAERVLGKAHEGVSWIRTQLRLPVRPFSLPLGGFTFQAQGWSGLAQLK